MSTPPSVLFACIRNAGRSVAAQVLLRHHAGGSVEVRSAGSQPGAGVDPAVARVLAERGLPVLDHVPTRLDRELVEAADVVVTMGCGETCPVLPGKRYEDWPVDDPAGQDLAAVRLIVDDVDARVRALLAGLLAPSAGAVALRPVLVAVDGARTKQRGDRGRADQLPGPADADHEADEHQHRDRADHVDVGRVLDQQDR